MTTTTSELITLDELRTELDGRELPGAELAVESYESALADHALLAPAEDTDHAHPLWLLVIALRGMGITVDELCERVGKREQDMLLFGNCGISQHRPLRIGHRVRTTASVGPVSRKESRGGGLLDFVTVSIDVYDLTEPGAGPVGSVTEGFIFKRGA